MPYTRCPPLVHLPDADSSEHIWNGGAEAREEHRCLLQTLNFNTWNNKLKWYYEKMFEASVKYRVTQWVPDHLRSREAAAVVMAFFTERCEKYDPKKKYSDFFKDPMPFREDNSWSVIYLQAAHDEDRYPKVSQAQECLLHTQSAWKHAMHGTSPWNLFAILMDGLEDSCEDDLGCKTKGGLDGVYCFPLNKSDGKADWQKAVPYSVWVPLQNDGVFFQVLIFLVIDYADRRQRSAQGTDQWCIPARSCRVMGVVFRALPLEMLPTGGEWHYAAWNPYFEMPPKKILQAKTGTTGGSSPSTPQVLPTRPPPPLVPQIGQSPAKAKAPRIVLPDPVRTARAESVPAQISTSQAQERTGRAESSPPVALAASSSS
jgi:hypothetical protein